MTRRNHLTTMNKDNFQPLNGRVPFERKLLSHVATLVGGFSKSFLMQDVNRDVCCESGGCKIMKVLTLIRRSNGLSQILWSKFLASCNLDPAHQSFIPLT